jgi:hypothetical protein
VANVPPNSPVIAPGIDSSTTFPQWGVKQTTATTTGSGAGDYTTLEATTAAEKQTDIDNGYDVWFSSAAAASSYISSESSSLNGNISSVVSTPLQEAESIWGTLTSANLWIRIAKVLAGGVMLLVGLAHITGADNAAASLARKVPLPV